MSDLEMTYAQLPNEIRILVDFQTRKVREAVLTTIGNLLDTWEMEGAKLDPIQGELIISGLAKVLVELNAELRDERNLVTMMLGAP